MDSNSDPVVESSPISTAKPPSSEPNLAKQEQPDITNTRTVDIAPPSLINSIKDLRNLSTALSVFLRRYDELHDHLNFIKTSIDSKLPNHLLFAANPSQSLTPLTDTSFAHTITDVPVTTVPEKNANGNASNCERSHENMRKPERPNFAKKHEEPDISKKPLETDTYMNRGETDGSTKPEETDTSKKHGETDISKKPALSELESFCERMCGRDMRKYVATHISDTNKLREEIPKALKLAKDPAKLVLESVGRFFLQGSRAFFKGSHQILGRLASVVILECFVMMSSDGIEIAKVEEEYAAKAAVDWRKRMIHEGGLTKTDEIDARGLLLLISGFGIPDHVFKNEDIWDLIRASNVKRISSALRRSVILIRKIPEVIDWMVKNDLEIEAADMAYTFGLEDKCRPQTILTTLLRNKIKDSQHAPSPHVNAAIKKQLSDLKSIRRCLKTHKIDPSKLLPNCKINEKIQQLEKEVNNLDFKSAKEKGRKRKVKEPESSRKQKQQEPKRTRLSSSRENVPQEPDAVDHYGKTTQLSSSYFDGKPPSDHISAYPTSSVSGPSENITSSVAIESGGGLAGGGMFTGSYGTGLYRGTHPDQRVNTTPFGWPHDSTLIEKYKGQPYPRQVQTYDLQPSTTGLIGLYGRQSLETFPGLPRSSPSPGFSARGGLALDLYAFADTVVENESSRGSYASGSGTMPSSYLY